MVEAFWFFYIIFLVFILFQHFQNIGCFVGTSENVLFKLLRDKNNPAFKAISKLNQDPTADTFGASDTLLNKL